MTTSLTNVVMRTLSLPYYFVQEILVAEDIVGNDLEIMGNVRVAVKIDCSSGLKDPSEFFQAFRHPIQILTKSIPSIIETIMVRNV